MRMVRDVGVFDAQADGPPSQPSVGGSNIFLRKGDADAGLTGFP